MATLEDHLRRVTRNFTAALPDPELLALGRDLARELARAHGEAPPRHPDLEPSRIAWADTAPRLDPGSDEGSVADDLFELGCLLHSLATATTAEVSWRLDGPPPLPGPLVRRSLLDGLASPRRERRFASAQEAARAFEGALAADVAQAHPWPLFRGDSARRGATSGPARDALEPLWEAAIGGVVSSPVLTASLAIAATANGRLLFVDRGTGRLVHELRLGSAVESSPALSGTQLHIGTDDGEYIAVDIARGEIVRRVRLGQVVRSSPLPAPEHVIVGAVEPRGQGSLVALHLSSVKLAWRLKLKAVFSSAAQAGDRVLVGSDDGSLHAVDLAKGTLAWSHVLGSKVRATPAIADALAVVGDFSGRLVAVNLASGERAWLAELGAALYSSACVASGLAVVGANDGRVHGVDLATGVVRFVLETRGPVVASPVASGGRFLVASTDGDLYLLDDHGRVLGTATLAPGGIASSPAVDAELVVVGSARGLHALRLA
jgi:outer membrane protein assembly factor BamB